MSSPKDFPTAGSPLEPVRETRPGVYQGLFGGRLALHAGANQCVKGVWTSAQVEKTHEGSTAAQEPAELAEHHCVHDPTLGSEACVNLCCRFFSAKHALLMGYTPQCKSSTTCLRNRETILAICMLTIVNI